MNLYRVTNEDTKKPSRIDERKWENIQYHIHLHRGFTNRKKWLTSLKRIICEEKECSRYELLTEECLNIQKLVFYGNQYFEEGHRPIEHN